MEENNGQLILAENSRSRYVIVLPANPLPAVKHSANELQQHLALMSGAVLPIQDTQPAPQQAIVLMPSQDLAEEEFTIKTVGQQLVIAGGGKRGVLYGCYALLEDVLGVRWYTSRITHIPERRTLTVGPLDMHDKPDFEYREPFYTEAFEKNWAVRNRTNGTHQLLDESVGGKVAYGRLFVHSFNDLVSPDIYYDEHPEYFSLIDGKRMKGEYQLCLTNPDVLRISIESVKDWIQKTPDSTIFSVSQNDVYFNCQCEDCRAVDAEEGAPSGLVLHFVNAIADAVAEEYPHVLIDTLAYQWTEDPPKYARPRPNVRIRLAPIYACFGHPLNGCEANTEAFANLKAWSEITNQLYVWHYSTNFAHYPQPFPNLDEVVGDIPLFKQYGTVGLFYEGGYAPGGECAQAELESYLMAKLMWHTDRPAAPIIADFLQGVYGKAAPYIQEWLDLIHGPVRMQNVHVRIWDPPISPYLSDEILERGQRIFDAAEAAVADNTLTLEMVQRMRLGLDYVRLMRSLPVHHVVSDTYKRTEAANPGLLGTVETKVAQYGIGQIREGQPVWRFFIKVTDCSEYPVLTIESDALRVDAVAALGGRIVRLLDKASGRNLLREPSAAERNYPAAGGYAESIGILDRSMGSHEEYQGEMVNADSGSQAIVLTAQLKNGVQISRRLSLAGSRLDIVTTLENKSDARQATALRSTVELSWPAGSEPQVVYQAADGTQPALALPEPGHTHVLPYTSLAEQRWTAQLGSVALTQTFAGQPVATATFVGSRTDRGLGLVLTAEPKTLAPGERYSLEQSWAVTAI